MARAQPPVSTSLDVPGFPAGTKFACIVADVYSAEECAALIRRTEEIGYKPAKEGDQSGRSNFRCIVEDDEVAADLFQRIRHLLPVTWTFENPYDATYRIVTDTLLGVNSRLRFQRYTEGQEFMRHVDGSYEREDGSARTHITLQLYLNDNFEGGATTFIDPQHYKAQHDVPLDVVPQTGRVLIFEHELLHAGAAVVKGCKYTLRTDVLYRVHKASAPTN